MREDAVAEHEMVAAILATGLTAHQRTAPSDVLEAVRVYHACLEALRHHGDVPAEARWSAAGELRRLTEQDAQKPG
jgi:hypothetical protein